MIPLKGLQVIRGFARLGAFVCISWDVVLLAFPCRPFVVNLAEAMIRGVSGMILQVFCLQAATALGKTQRFLLMLPSLVTSKGAKTGLTT